VPVAGDFSVANGAPAPAFQLMLFALSPRAGCAAGFVPPPLPRSYSLTMSPEPPNSFGKSLNFGSPSFIGSTVSW